MTLIFTDRVKNNLWSSVKSVRTELKMKFIESHPQLVEKFSMPTNDSTKSSQMTLIFTDRVKNNLWSSVKSVRTELKMKFIESHPQLVEKFSMLHN